MNAVVKIVSLLLSYPTQELKEAMPAIRQALDADAGLDARMRDRLTRLADDIGRLDIYEAQERYVHLFDRTRSLSLHLFEHVYGESRDRGQAMVDLMEMYEAQGLEIDAKELPDYLPLFLEFVSMLPGAEARELLGQVAHIVSALKERLRKRRPSMPARSRCWRRWRTPGPTRSAARAARRAGGRPRRPRCARPRLAGGGRHLRGQRGRERLRPGPPAHAHARRIP